MNFVFYDTEATGPDPGYDQIISVAAVLTDDALNEIDRLDLRCRLRPHQLPAAEALLLTGFGMDELTDPALPSHFEMITALRDRLLSWGPAVFTGYSSLEFDEPLIAESLRRCLYPAELTRGARLDVQRLALGLHEFLPGTIAFTTRFDGKPSFRLTDLVAANDLAAGRAHDAMGDVAMTLELARLLRGRAPDMWSHMVAMGQPEEAVNFAMQAPVRLYTEFHHNRPHHWLVTSLGRISPRGDLLGFDLAHDPAEGQSLDGDALVGWLRHHPRPLRPILVEECPFILPRHCAGERLICPDAERRARLLAGDNALRERLLAAHAEIEPPSDASPDDQAALLLQYERDPSGMDPSARSLVDSMIAERMMAPETAPHMTLSRAFDEADRALENAADEEMEQIEALLDYLRTELAWAESRLQDQNRSKPNS